MRPHIALATCLLVLPIAAQAATRTYDTPAFHSIQTAAGVTVDVRAGRSHRVVAETTAKDFADLRISVDDGVLRIERPRRSWFWFGRRPDYRVRVDAPELRGVSASSGSRVTVVGERSGGNLSVSASSGSSVDMQVGRSSTVSAHSSSGSQLRLRGSCQSLTVEASSGSNLDAADLHCADAEVQASSGSAVSLAATRRVAGSASSGSSVRVAGGAAVVEVRRSSGAAVQVRN